MFEKLCFWKKQKKTGLALVRQYRVKSSKNIGAVQNSQTAFQKLFNYLSSIWCVLLFLKKVNGSSFLNGITIGSRKTIRSQRQGNQAFLNKIFSSIFLGFLGIYFLFIMGSAGFFLGKQNITVTSIFILVSIIFIVFNSLSIITEPEITEMGIFTSTDHLNFLSFPIQIRTFFLAKLLINYISGLVGSILFFCPIFIGLGIARSFSWDYYLKLFLFFPLLDIGDVLIKLFVLGLFARVLIQLRKNVIFKTVTYILTFLLAVTLVLGIAYIFSNLKEEIWLSQFFQDFSVTYLESKTLKALVYILSPLLYPFIYLLQNSGITAIPYMLIFLLMALVFIFGIDLFGKKLYWKVYSAVHDSKKSNQSQNFEKQTKEKTEHINSAGLLVGQYRKKNKYRAFLIKDWRQIKRMPQLLFNLILGPSIVPLIVIFSMGMGYISNFSFSIDEIAQQRARFDYLWQSAETFDHRLWIYMIAPALFSLLVGFFSSGNVGPAQTSWNREGKGFYFLKTLPFSYKGLFLLKTLFSTLFFVPTLLIYIFIMLFFKVPFYLMVSLLLTWCLTVLLTQGMTVYTKTWNIDADWLDEKELLIQSSQGKILKRMIFSFITFIPYAFYALVALLMFWIKSPNMIWIYPICFLLIQSIFILLFAKIILKKVETTLEDA